MNFKIPWAKPVFAGKEKEYLTAALESTWISGGAFVDRFEEEFTKYNKSNYGITTSNGTTALQLALLGLGIGPGDEVIVPGFTFVAPANMAIAAGAVPVYADVLPDTWCINPQSVSESITPRTKAIIAVHMYGNVCDMDALKLVAVPHKISIVEDTAEAPFSRYKGGYAGALGDIGCFSFQATKTITMGEGGMVLTDNKELHDRMRLIRDHGMRKNKRYWHDAIGFNFRLTNLQAAVGCAQLEQIEYIISERKRLYSLYCKKLKGIGGVEVQKIDPDVDAVIWAFVVRLNFDAFKGDRDFIMGELLQCGIETRPGFYPFSEMPLYNTPPLPVSSAVAASTLALPFYPSLRDEEVSFICDSLLKLRK